MIGYPVAPCASPGARSARPGVGRTVSYVKACPTTNIARLDVHVAAAHGGDAALDEPLCYGLPTQLHTCAVCAASSLRTDLNVLLIGQNDVGRRESSRRGRDAVAAHVQYSSGARPDPCLRFLAGPRWHSHPYTSLRQNPLSAPPARSLELALPVISPPDDFRGVATTGEQPTLQSRTPHRTHGREGCNIMMNEVGVVSAQQV